MAYVKLDTGILNSTLWVDRECREVFITALLMAEPVEATESLATYEVRSLDKTPFVVPAGWYGIVRAAGVGIVRFAMTDPDAGMAALERLAAKDPESRSQDFEGRRLVRVDGGFIVLNYFKYRDRDHTSATRSKRYRDRIKASTVTRDEQDDTRSVTVELGGVTRDITEAVSSKQEADALTTTTHTHTLATQFAGDHQTAYLATRAGARNPEAFDATLRTLNVSMTGGAAYEWRIIGQALLDIRANGGNATANAVRAFCRKLTQPEPPRRHPGILTDADWKDAARKAEAEELALQRKYAPTPEVAS